MVRVDRTTKGPPLHSRELWCIYNIISSGSVNCFKKRYLLYPLPAVGLATNKNNGKELT
jgi:hypothetical protein